MLELNPSDGEGEVKDMRRAETSKAMITTDFRNIFER